MSGYCNTPIHSRFKKGQSGNPSGRRRPRPLEDLISCSMEVVKGGRVVKLPAFEIELAAIIRRGVQGDSLPHLFRFLDLCRKYEVATPPGRPRWGVVHIPDLPDGQLQILLDAHGPPPWTEIQIRGARDMWLETRSEFERLLDENGFFQ